MAHDPIGDALIEADLPDLFFEEGDEQFEFERRAEWRFVDPEVAAAEAALAQEDAEREAAEQNVARVAAPIAPVPIHFGRGIDFEARGMILANLPNLFHEEDDEEEENWRLDALAFGAHRPIARIIEREQLVPVNNDDVELADLEILFKEDEGEIARDWRWEQINREHRAA